MTEAEGFVVQGNKRAWRRHALRGIVTGFAAADILSILSCCYSSHLYTAQHMPLNIMAGTCVADVLAMWAFSELLISFLIGWMTIGNTPLISVSHGGVFIRSVGVRPCRIPWEEITSIYLGNAFAFPLFEWQKLRSVVVVPRNSAAFCRHLTEWERRWAFGSASLSVPQRAGWIGVSGLIMEISPDEFMRRLNDYYQKYAWRPGLPGGPYPVPTAISAEPSRHLSVTLPTGNVEQSRDVFYQTRVLNSGQTRRRALHRTLRHTRAGIRRRMPNQYRAERLPAMLNQETQTKTDPKTVASVASDTDTRVTPDELTAAIEAIERRKAEAQKRMAETIPVDQAVRELGIDATPEELLAEVRAQRAARAGVKPASGPAMPPAPGAPQAPFTKESFEKFIKDFVKESGLDALPDEIIARLRARRVAREQAESRTAQGVPVLSAPGKARVKRDRSGFGVGIGISAFLFFFWATNEWQHLPFATSGHGSAPIVKPLSEIPENHPVNTDTANLQKIIEGKPADTVTVIDNEDVHHNEWTVVKESGHYYVWAYLPARVTASALKAAPLTLYNAEHDTPGDSSVKVTAPLDGTKIANVHDDGEDSTISLSNVHLDDNSYDQW